MEEHPSVTDFRTYLKMNTSHPSPDYTECRDWLMAKGKEAGGKVSWCETVPGKPVVIVTFLGQEPNLPSVMLNSHTDVVPVFPEYWKHDPFSAHKDANGDIYARGSQDMKCVGIQYLEAMKKIVRSRTNLKRTVHLTFMPEEELGGVLGMKIFVEMPQFAELNVGFALDEGYASEDDSFWLFYGERTVWRFYVRCEGSPGHGSQFIKNTASAKLTKMLNYFQKFRDEQEEKLALNPSLHLGDVTTVNMTLLDGGVQFNVVPAVLKAGFDVRIAATQNLEELEQMFTKWCIETENLIDSTSAEKTNPGSEVDKKKSISELFVRTITLEFERKGAHIPPSCVENGKSPWWDAFTEACKTEDIHLKKTIFPAATDSRFLREKGIQAFGFSPMNNTPILLHDHNEFLNEKTFLRGIDIYCTIIQRVANVA